MDGQTLKDALESFLREDVGSGDVTTENTPDKDVTAVVSARQQGVLAGLKEGILFLTMHGICAETEFKDGALIHGGDKILSLSGRSHMILTLERTLLNVLSKMSGIATHTRKYVEIARKANPNVRVAATRKTTPLFRYFEKRAVVVGGGAPHRMGLYDRVLIKDNHIVVFGGVAAAVNVLKEKSDPSLEIEVEVSSLADAVSAAEAGADIIMLDNMRPRDMAAAIRGLAGKGLRDKVEIEVSGGIRLENIPEYAKTGADVLSTSDLISGAPSLDFTLTVM